MPTRHCCQNKIVWVCRKLPADKYIDDFKKKSLQAVLVRSKHRYWLTWQPILRGLYPVECYRDFRHLRFLTSRSRLQHSFTPVSDYKGTQPNNIMDTCQVLCITLHSHVNVLFLSFLASPTIFTSRLKNHLILCSLNERWTHPNHLFSNAKNSTIEPNT